MSIVDIDPDVVSTVRGAVNVGGKLYSEDEGTIETRHRKKDGTLRPVEASFKYVTFEGEDYSSIYPVDFSPY